MMYLVYDTEADAQTAAAVIWGLALQFGLPGHTVVDGVLVNDETGGRSERWDIPRHHAEGWCVLWPPSSGKPWLADFDAVAQAQGTTLAAILQGALTTAGVWVTPQTVTWPAATGL